MYVQYSTVQYEHIISCDKCIVVNVTCCFSNGITADVIE
jgi:hypothetical protein